MATTTALQPPTSTAPTSSPRHADAQTKPEGGETAAATAAAALQAPEISSPHQLIDWVDTVLGQLETRFDDMNGQVTARSKFLPSSREGQSEEWR